MKNGNTRRPKELYHPVTARICRVLDLTSDVRIYSLERPRGLTYSPGQFLMASVWGAGEVPISITSTYGLHEHIELCIRKVGLVTSALHKLGEGDEMLIRGPFGNRFNFEEALGRDVLFVAGGIGIVPLRSLINLVMRRKDGFNEVALIYGSRNPSEVLFEDEIREWEKSGMSVTLTVDAGSASWTHNFGLVTEFLNKQSISIKNGFSYICGPHLMINSVMRDLSLMGMPPDNIITTIEAHMKCGVGKCGHCYTAGKYVCIDGPVYSYSELKKTGMSAP